MTEFDDRRRAAPRTSLAGLRARGSLAATLAEVWASTTVRMYVLRTLVNPAAVGGRTGNGGGGTAGYQRLLGP